LAGPISGGHLNPAVSFVSYLNKSIDQTDFIYYVVAQIAGAYAAKQYFDRLQ
jgi:glycerol uptake facilitator-like aquaporin